MPTQAYALFPTPIGHCAVAWGVRGLTGVQLPEQDEAATRARMGRRFPQCSEESPPPQVQAAIDAVVALLSGAPRVPVDLSNVMLDMDGVPPFHQRVYELARRLLPGETVTYGEMARQLDDPGAARRGRSGRHWAPTRLRQWCRVTACSLPTGARAASRPMVVSRPSCVCC